MLSLTLKSERPSALTTDWSPTITTVELHPLTGIVTVSRIISSKLVLFELKCTTIGDLGIIAHNYKILDDATFAILAAGV